MSCLLKNIGINTLHPTLTPYKVMAIAEAVVKFCKSMLKKTNEFDAAVTIYHYLHFFQGSHLLPCPVPFQPTHTYNPTHLKCHVIALQPVPVTILQQEIITKRGARNVQYERTAGFSRIDKGICLAVCLIKPSKNRSTLLLWSTK